MVILGALLIGGQSQRMGAVKSLLERNGQPLSDYLCGLLEAQTGHPPVIVGYGACGPRASGLVRVPDRPGGSGPLAGLMGLFDLLADCTCLVLATDLFAMHGSALAWLVSQYGSNARPAVWPRLPGRPFGEPLAAIYGPAAWAPLTQAWGRGERRLHQAMPAEFRDEPVIPEPLRLAFQNANTPAQLDAIKRAMQG